MLVRLPFLIALTCLAVAGEAGPPLEPGVVIAFAAPAGGDAVDARVDRLVALHVPAGEAPSPFAPAGAFSATIDGVIVMDVWDQVVLSVEGRGAASVALNGATVVEAAGPDLAAESPTIKLKTGRNALRVTYRSPPDGDASLRLRWRSARKPDAKNGVPDEPIPPTVLRHDPAHAALVASAPRRAGRALVGELRCARCHDPGKLPAAAMPELERDAPTIHDAAGRLEAAWIAAWILDPRAQRPSATMPRVAVPTATRDAAQCARDAWDMAAALTANAPAAARDAAVADAATVAAGQRLYARLGCMGCHATGAAGDAADVPLGHVRAKFAPGALAEFLAKPDAHYRWSRMGAFALSADEVRQLAAYLIATSAGEPAQPAPRAGAPDAGRGQGLLVSYGCFNCHVQAGVAPAKPLAEAARAATAGCLGDDDAARGGAPDFGLDAARRAALRAFLATDRAALAVRDRAEAAERRIGELRCAACHARDGVESAWSHQVDARKAVIAAAAAAPAEPPATMYADLPPPALTHAGDKLRPEWMAAFIAGDRAQPVRPWLHLRMPAFAAHAATLAQGIAAQHGFAATSPADPPVDAAVATVGERLLSGANALICNQCHAVGVDKPATQVFEHPGPDLAASPTRLTHAYYLRWMRNPPRIADLGMPKFSDDDGMTGLTEVLGGKAVDQYEAIWQFLRTRAK